MGNKSNVSIGARLDRLPQSKWHIKMWLVTAFALLVCWSNGIGGAVQNILLNEIHWLESGTALLAMWGTIYTAGQLFGGLGQRILYVLRNFGDVFGVDRPAANKRLVLSVLGQRGHGQAGDQQQSGQDQGNQLFHNKVPFFMSNGVPNVFRRAARPAQGGSLFCSSRSL